MAAVTGKQIKDWLEKELNNVFTKAAEERLGGWVVKFKGIKIFFNTFDENGKRVKEISVGGKAHAPDKAYNICAC